MRLWSIHPRYLDRQGLLALWREGLLAKKVLEGKTHGYKNHPQLVRFKNSPAPTEAINYYLGEIYYEAEKRGYCFNKQKISHAEISFSIPVSRGQIVYEFNHLELKVKRRNPDLFEKLNAEKEITPHPLFITVEGPVESWEKRN